MIQHEPSAPRSDGSRLEGPFRRSLDRARRDLSELQKMQRVSEAQMVAELQRRDADAMTAFFVENMERWEKTRARKEKGERRDAKGISAA